MSGITCDGAWLRGNIVPLKKIVDDTLQRAGTIQAEITVIGHEIQPIAKPTRIEFMDNLPKSRSSKIVRRVI